MNSLVIRLSIIAPVTSDAILSVCLPCNCFIVDHPSTWSLPCYKFLVVLSTLNDGLFSCQFISKQSSFSTVFTLAFNLVKDQLPAPLRVSSPVHNCKFIQVGFLLYLHVVTSLVPY